MKPFLRVFFFSSILLPMAGWTQSKLSEKELRAKLTPEQFEVTQKCSTEPPFKNAYWNHFEDGVYVDVVSGEPLFLSLDKFVSSSGWPSFVRPIQKGAVKEKPDTAHGMTRTEIKSSKADSHLGHVFPDGPKERGGLRYCINSASLRFVPLDKLKDEGLGEYLFAFSEKKQWQSAVLAGGCFWGMEELLRKLPGVIETQVGYAGGKTPSPTYSEVSGGKSGHAESIEVLFDPKKTTYETVLLEFFRIHDPTTKDQQGNDRGSQYRSAIFYKNEEQKRVAEKVMKRVERSGLWKKPLTTELSPSGGFTRAEPDHQKYLQRKPGGYTCHFPRPFKF